MYRNQLILFPFSAFLGTPPPSAECGRHINFTLQGGAARRRAGEAAQVCLRAEAEPAARPGEGRGEGGGGRGQGRRGQGGAGTEGE